MARDLPGSLIRGLLQIPYSSKQCGFQKENIFHELKLGDMVGCFYSFEEHYGPSGGDGSPHASLISHMEEGGFSSGLSSRGNASHNSAMFYKTNWDRGGDMGPLKRFK